MNNVRMQGKVVDLTPSTRREMWLDLFASEFVNHGFKVTAHGEWLARQAGLKAEDAVAKFQERGQ